MIFNSLKKHLGSSGIIAFALLTLYSCGTQTTDNSKEMKDTVPAETNNKPKTQNVFYSIPSPIQLGKFLQRAGAKYDKKVLNSLENVSKYSTTTSKALNLGVYGADLSYSAIFNQTQETSSYLNVSKKLADDIGISSAFSKEAIKRMEANLSNRDSLLQIISELFMNSNEALKENEQSNISGLVISGGFIEGLYVGTQVVKAVKDNKGIITRIAELKGSLNNLIALLSVEKQDANIIEIVNDLKEIKAIYDEMPVAESQPAVAKSDSTKNTITIKGSGSHYNLTKEQLERITVKAEAIRTKITKP